jgi:hypothetical protein
VIHGAKLQLRATSPASTRLRVKSAANGGGGLADPAAAQHSRARRPEAVDPAADHAPSHQAIQRVVSGVAAPDPRRPGTAAQAHHAAASDSNSADAQPADTEPRPSPAAYRPPARSTHSITPLHRLVWPRSRRPAGDASAAGRHPRATASAQRSADHRQEAARQADVPAAAAVDTRPVPAAEDPGPARHDLYVLPFPSTGEAETDRAYRANRRPIRTTACGIKIHHLSPHDRGCSGRPHPAPDRAAPQTASAPLGLASDRLGSGMEPDAASPPDIRETSARPSAADNTDHAGLPQSVRFTSSSRPASEGQVLRYASWPRSSSGLQGDRGSQPGTAPTSA